VASSVALAIAGVVAAKGLETLAALGCIPNPYEYTGSYLDTNLGLYKLGIRYYDPTLGRFTQPDPTGQDAHYIYSG
jgi:RHS repeat-associated protein